MNTKQFLFRDVLATHVKVSHGVFIGLPSLSGITGLNRNFCIQLAKAVGLPSDAFQPSGALLAIEGYHQHEGYKKGHKAGTASYEAIPAAWASFTAHIALEVSARTQQAVELLASTDLSVIAAELLQGMSLCKGRLNNVKPPVNLAQARLQKFGSERNRVLHCLPAASMVLRDCSDLVRDMRTEGINLMEGLVAATLRHALRPAVYRTFFEADDRAIVDWHLIPVMSGVRILEQGNVGKSIRKDANGNSAATAVGSPAFTLVRLQKAASVRLRVNEEAGTDVLPVFFKEKAHSLGYFSSAY
ncbi:MAG: hypothetical protein Q7S87_01520 [Agitococcus sp.]|nr:hypothetical protein [Agitococcus sp.]